MCNMTSSVLKPIVGVTGHRTMIHDKATIKAKLKEMLKDLNAGHVITGMALGFDQLVAETCIEEGISYTAAIPCFGQDRLWPQDSQRHYRKLVDKASRTKVVSPGDYHPSKMHIRNQWIVNNSSVMICYWDGNDKGGTASCLKFAKSKNKEVRNVFTSLSLPAAFVTISSEKTP